jgi:hypothetical protein
MTKKQRRDKVSYAHRHRKKSTERSFVARSFVSRSLVGCWFIEGASAFACCGCGFVKLARRRGRGKVAKKARIPVAPSRLHDSPTLAVIWWD